MFAVKASGSVPGKAQAVGRIGSLYAIDLHLIPLRETRNSVHRDTPITDNFYRLRDATKRAFEQQSLKQAR